MLLTILMFYLWQIKGSTYEIPFNKSAEIVYNNSKLNIYTTSIGNRLYNLAPAPIFIAGAAYKLATKKEITLKNSKYIPISISYNNIAKSSSINLTIPF